MPSIKNLKTQKEQCGYSDKPVLTICSNCEHFTSEKILPAWMVERNKSGEGQFFELDGKPYTAEENGVEKNLRCNLHDFAVKKMGSCNNWEARQRA